jgi:hypothetical protein
MITNNTLPPVPAYFLIQGMPFMVPYATSKGAELALTRSLSAALVNKGAWGFEGCFMPQ